MWEPRSVVDSVLVEICSQARSHAKLVGALAVVAVLLNSFSLTVLSLVLHPIVGFFAVASVVPAAFVAIYLWLSDPLQRRPALVLVGAFVLGHVAVAFAYLANTAAQPWFDALPYLSLVIFFFLFVAPVEEALKLVTVYVHPLRGALLRTPMDGMVFGAFTGLGFATAENAVYVVTGGFLGTGGFETIIGRAGVAPAHVMWTAIAGYYLGLASVNRRYVAPLVLKGFLGVVFLHGAYNVSVSYLPGAVGLAVEPEQFSVEIVTLAFLLIFYGLMWFILESLVRKYRRGVSGGDLRAV